MLTLHNKHVDVRAAARAMNAQSRAGAAGQGPQILIPRRGSTFGLDEYFWKALKEGWLQEYIRSEKGQAALRHRRVARQVHGRTGFQQNRGTDFKRVFDIPAREYFRWQNVDPHFWDEKSNLKSYKRDNPDACIHEV